MTVVSEESPLNQSAHGCVGGINPTRHADWCGSRSCHRRFKGLPASGCATGHEHNIQKRNNHTRLHRPRIHVTPTPTQVTEQPRERDARTMARIRDETQNRAIPTTTTSLRVFGNPSARRADMGHSGNAGSLWRISCDLGYPGCATTRVMRHHGAWHQLRHTRSFRSQRRIWWPASSGRYLSMTVSGRVGV